MSAFFLFSNTIWGQKDILELLPGSYKLVYNEKTGAQKLVGGGVNFKYQGNTMYCDSAYFFAKKSEVRAYGKVHINKNDTLNLFCDSMHYNGVTKKAKLWGNVRVRDREYKLVTDTLEYDAKKGRAIYRNGGRVESIISSEVLTSRIGYFYPDSKNLFFSGRVDYKSDNLSMVTDTLQYKYAQKKAYFYGPTTIYTQGSVMKCDKGWFQTEKEEGLLEQNASIHKDSKIITGNSLYVNSQKGISIGKGNVVYRDTSGNMSFMGDYSYLSDKDKNGYLTGNAIAEYRLKKDTLFIHADTLFSFQDSLNELKTVLAYYEVRIFSKDFQGKCDSLSYDKLADKMELFHSPILWSQNAELKGDKMEVFLKDSLIDFVQISNKATVIMEVDSAKYYNQIAGTTMFAYFDKNELHRVKVDQNAQTIYFPQDTLQNDTLVEVKRSGMARLYASNIVVYLDSGEVNRVVYVGMPDGVLYPMKQINKEEQFVNGFSWSPILRPRSVEDLLEPKREKKM
jgi:lipopolysaccharide export system protein LptA